MSPAWMFWAASARESASGAIAWSCTFAWRSSGVKFITVSSLKTEALLTRISIGPAWSITRGMSWFASA